MIETVEKYGFVKYLLDNGAQISPLEINYNEIETLASMNPSIWIDGNIGYINVRAVNYNLFNSRYREYNQNDQPISYINKKAYYLETENYFGTIDLNTLDIKQISKVQMMNTHEPAWLFTGLEDARIIKWDENIYLCGVRRDIQEDGQGRMELTKIEYIDNEWVETERTRIPAAGDDTAYLEKNWMPIIDKPWHWIKWSSPFEYCIYDKNTNTLKCEFNGNYRSCFRGDSHLVHIGNYYYCFVHDVLNKQLRQETNARVSYYKHYILRINEDLSPAGIFGPFSYDNRFNIEFGCGLAYKDGKLYLTYAEDDAIALIVKFDVNIIINLPYVDQNELYIK